MNVKILLIGLFILIACSRDKNKPYEKVNIIRDEKQKKPKVKPELKIPTIYAKSNMLLIELSQSNLIVNSWEKDSVLIDKTFPQLGNDKSEIYQGNNQIIIREKTIDKNTKGNTWKVFVPKFTNLTIRSDNGTVKIENVSGTFNINSPVGNVEINGSSAALQVLSQSGDIEMKNFELMGRSKLSSASGKVKIDSKGDLAYVLNAHSGSDTILIQLNKNQLKMNLELLTFRNMGSVYSEFNSSEVEDFYSDALNIHYDLRKVQLDESYPTSSISTGNGTILILR